jgi:hypothetical protein
MMFAIDLSYIAFTILRYITSILDLDFSFLEDSLLLLQFHFVLLIYSGD